MSEWWVGGIERCGVFERCVWCGGEFDEGDVVVCGGFGDVRLRCGGCVYERCIRNECGCEERVCEFVVERKSERVVVGESERVWVVSESGWWWWVRERVRDVVREWVWRKRVEWGGGV